MSDAASNRPSVADLVVSNMGNARGKQGVAKLDLSATFDIYPAEPGSEG